MPDITSVKLKRMLVDAKEMRDFGFLEGDAVFFLIARPILTLAKQMEELEASPKFMRLSDKMMAIEEQHGQGPLPQEWHNLDYEWYLLLDKIIAGKFIECEEQGMAALYTSDRCEFGRRYENGQRLASRYRYNG